MMRLRLNISIAADGRDGQSHGELHISEEVQLEVRDFMECAHVLGKFHELAEALKAKGKK